MTKGFPFACSKHRGRNLHPSPNISQYQCRFCAVAGNELRHRSAKPLKHDGIRRDAV